MKLSLFIPFIVFLLFSCRSVDNTTDEPVISPIDSTVAPIPDDSIVLVELSVTIDVSKKGNAVSKNSAGVVACWLMDSDIERPRETSFSDAMKGMGVKYIRFPYGHLADNYLWDADGDWGNALTPKVATFSQAPGSWEWAVDQTTGEFIKDMDFDEYISICDEVGAEPMVVVNILASNYADGPTYAQLKESAVEWVRYANITKGYNVKRWALGNEVDHHPEFISQAEYKDLYVDFAAAMKAVDSTILVGPGLLSNWHSAMLSYAPELIDFICVHNYLYAYDWRNDNYEGWKSATDIMVNNVEKCQKAVDNSSIPDTEIHVTEMNSRPWKDKEDNDDIFRALAYGEMLLNAVSFEDVKATYVWNSHGPWGGESENAPYNILDLDNNLEPRGEVMKMVNDNMLDFLVEVPRVNEYVRQYASVNENNDCFNLILINKDDEQKRFKFDVIGFESASDFTLHSYSGVNDSDENPQHFYDENSLISATTGETILMPLSLTVITFSKN